MTLGILQLKKRYVYGAIAFIWIVIPTLEVTIPSVTSAIVQGTCVRFGGHLSYAEDKTIGFFSLFVAYFLPLTVMVFCYARNVRALRAKVILTVL